MKRRAFLAFIPLLGFVKLAAHAGYSHDRATVGRYYHGEWKTSEIVDTLNRIHKIMEREISRCHEG